MIRYLSPILVLALVGWFFTANPLRAETTNKTSASFTIIENNVAYLRVTEVVGNLADEISSARQRIAFTNKIIGTVLDLRFADGNYISAAKASAAILIAKKLPLTILVNSETRGAAAALATELRSAREGLVIGGATAELQPDIAVKVAPKDERLFLKNPYAALALSGTNSATLTNNFTPFIDHTSEADLVRAKIKDGEEDADLPPSRAAEPQKPFIHDPALARAVDLLKALAVRNPPQA